MGGLTKSRALTYETSATTHNDVMKELHRPRYDHYPGDGTPCRIVTDIFGGAATRFPSGIPSPLSGFTFAPAERLERSAEVAFTSAQRHRLVEAVSAPACNLRIAPQAFLFSMIHNDLLEEVASFAPRAGCGPHPPAIMRDRFTPRIRGSLLLRSTTQTAAFAVPRRNGEQYVRV